MERIIRRRSPDDPLKGDKRRQDKHQNSGEGDAKENIVHDTASPFIAPPATLLTTGTGSSNGPFIRRSASLQARSRPEVGSSHHRRVSSLDFDASPVRGSRLAISFACACPNPSFKLSSRDDAATAGGVATLSFLAGSILVFDAKG